MNMLSTLSRSVPQEVFLHDDVGCAETLRGRNNTISGNNNLELNEKLMNVFYIKLLKGDYDSIQVGGIDSAMIENLANSCPFVNGYGVYKARILCNILGINYDNYNDIYLCNAAGMYKNGNYLDEDFQIDPILLDNLRQSNIKVYPNPFNDQVTIDYILKVGQKGYLKLYDLQGREQQSIELSASVNRVTVNLTNINRGMYVYKYIVDNRVTTTGKLLKE